MGKNSIHLQEASKMRNIHGIIKRDLIKIFRLQMLAQLAPRSKIMKEDAIVVANRNLLMPSTFVLGQRTSKFNATL